MDIEAKVKEILAEQLGIDEVEIKRESHLVDDLKGDSLDLVELIMAFEEEYSVEISDEDADKIKRVGDVLDYIKEHGAKAKS